MYKSIAATAGLAVVLATAAPAQAQTSAGRTMSGAAKRVALKVKNTGGTNVKARCRAPKRGRSVVHGHLPGERRTALRGHARHGRAQERADDGQGLRARVQARADSRHSGAGATEPVRRACRRPSRRPPRCPVRPTRRPAARRCSIPAPACLAARPPVPEPVRPPARRAELGQAHRARAGVVGEQQLPRVHRLAGRLVVRPVVDVRLLLVLQLRPGRRASHRLADELRRPGLLLDRLPGGVLVPGRVDRLTSEPRSAQGDEGRQALVACVRVSGRGSCARP